MNYRLDANPDVEPSLAEMALTALNILEKNSNGYFLLIEGEIFFYITDCVSYRINHFLSVIIWKKRQLILD